MRIIAIETSGDKGSVALRVDGASFESSFSAVSSHTRELLPRLSELLERRAFQPQLLDLIAVDIGPGSYTGLRIGVITARTIAWTLEKPIVGVISADIIARNVPVGEVVLAVLLDAKQGQIYARTYKAGGNIWLPREEPFIISPERLKTILPKKALLAGDALRRHEKILRAPGWERLEESFWQPRASTVAEMAEEMFRGGHRDDIYRLQPLYLRRSMAEELWDKRKRESPVEKGKPPEGFS